MKRIGKLCALLLCFAVVSGGCAQSGENRPADSGQMDSSDNSVETEAESDSASVDEEKQILKQNPQDEVIFTFDYDPSEYLKMDEDYRNIVLKAEDLEISEDEVQNHVDSLLTEYTVLEEVTDRGALAGDTLQVDFTGTLDGEVIYDEKDYQLELGTSGLIPGFEDQLEGARAGDEIKMDMEYPEDYGDEMLNGKTVHFDVTVYKVYLSVVPDYTDDFVKEHTEYDTTADYEAAIRSILEDSARLDAVAVWLDEHAVMERCPEELKEQCEQRMVDFLEQYAEYEGTSLEELLKKMDYASVEELLADEDNAASVEADEKDILINEYVVSRENLKSTVKEYVEYMEKYAGEQGYADADELLDYYSEEEMRLLYMKQLVSDCVLKYAVIE